MSEEQEETLSIKERPALLFILVLAIFGYVLALSTIYHFDFAIYYFGILSLGLIVTGYLLHITVSVRVNVDHSKIREYLELSGQVFGRVLRITPQKVDSSDSVDFGIEEEYTTTIKYEYCREVFTYIHKSPTEIRNRTSNPRLLIRPDQPRTRILRDELEKMLSKTDVNRDKCEQRLLTSVVALFIIASSLSLMLAHKPTIVAFCVSYIVALFALIYCLERSTGRKPTIYYDYSSSINKEFISVHPRSFCEAFGAYLCFLTAGILLWQSIVLMTPIFWLVLATSVHGLITQKALKRYGTSVMGNVVYRFDADSNLMVVVFRILNEAASPSKQHKQQNEHDGVYTYHKVLLHEDSNKHVPCVEIDEWMYRRHIQSGRCSMIQNDENDPVGTELEQVAIVVSPAASPWIAALKTNAQQQTFSLCYGDRPQLPFLLLFLLLYQTFFLSLSLLFVAVLNAAMVGIAIVGVLIVCAFDFGLFGLPFARNETTHEKVSQEAETTTIRSTNEEVNATADISSTATSEW